jgi:hypothetical protein
MGDVPLGIAMRTWTFATSRSKARAINRRPSSFMQCILVSMRRLRWYPLQFRQSAQPKYLDARSASLGSSQQRNQPTTRVFVLPRYLCGFLV